MFLSRKPKDWQHLRDDDWSWLRKLDADNAGFYLEEAVAQGNLQCVRYIRDKHRHNNRFLILQTIKSIDLGYPDVAMALIFSAREPAALFDHGFRDLFPVTAAAGDLRVWDYFCKYQKIVTTNKGKATPADLLRIADKANFDAGVDHVIANNAENITQLMDDAFDLRMTTFAKLVDALPSSVPVPILSRYLVMASNGGDVQKIDLLIKAGADVQHDHGQALKTAALHGKKEAVTLLVNAGAKPDETMPDFITELRHAQNLPTGFVIFFENLMNQGMDSTLQTRMAQINAAEGGRYSLSASDTLADVQQLPTGATLTVLFNFTLRQQIIVAESKGHAPSAPTVIGFDKIDNAQTLEAATEKFIALGGDETLTPPLRGRGMLKIK